MTIQLNFNREKYLQILRSEGPTAALTTLHQDIQKWEHQAFEGKKGYQPELWQDLHAVRTFSRELWELSIQTK